MFNILILVLFLITCFLIFFSQSDNRKFNFKLQLQSFKDIWPILGIFILLWSAISLVTGEWQFNNLIGFSISFLSAWLISLTGYSQKQILILLFNFIFSLCPQTSLVAQILGLIVFSVSQKSLINDQLPTLVYLSSLQWINLNSLEADRSLHSSCILGFLTISFWLNYLKAKIIQKSLIVQTIVLVLIGLLSAFIITENILLAHKLYTWAFLFGFGILISSLSTKLPKWSQIALIGIATLLASRLIGTIGFIILAISALPFVHYGLAVAFWLIRTLLQIFIFQFNSNITGLNLMHPYTSAALFGGILLAHLILYWQKANYYFILAGGLFIVIFTNYFLHAEATSSFLLAFTITCLCLGFLKSKPNLLLFPAYLISLSLVFNNLLELGLEQTRWIRLIIFFILVLFCIISLCKFKKYNTV